MSRRLSEWIPGGVKPSHIGVYQRDYRKSRGDRAAGITYSHWDGSSWGMYGETKEIALKWRGFSSSYQNLPWRGLANPPKEPRKSAAKTES
jgi:hypothetical protein